MNVSESESESASPTSGVSIPIVDLSSSQDTKHVASHLADVLHRVGFFIITNHDVPHTLIDRVFDLSATFFEKPTVEQQRISKRQSAHFRGWEPVGAESTNGQPDWREQIDLWTDYSNEGNDNNNNNSLPIYHNLKGPNQWPDSPPEFRPTLEEWYQHMRRLGDRLMGLFALGLGLPPHRFQELFGDDRMSLIKLISYPPTPEGTFGVHAHHDTGFLTILAAGVTPGLQVQSIQHPTEWMDVPVIPYSFVINVGEALQHLTGNYLVATPHRVKTTAGRLSCGYFHGPSLDTSLAILADLPPEIRRTVEASEYHRTAGFMTQKGTTNDNGKYENYNQDRPKTWGALIWNYLARSYPDIMKEYYGP